MALSYPPGGGSRAGAPGALPQEGVDEVRPRLGEGTPEALDELVGRLGPQRRHPHALREGDEVERWPAELEHRVGPGAVAGCADAPELNVEDAVGGVVEDDGRDVEALAGVRPER